MGRGEESGCRRGADRGLSAGRSGRSSRLASARRADLARISGALRGCGRRGADRRRGRTGSTGAAGRIRTVAARRARRFAGQRVDEAVSRFEAGSTILLLGDGVVRRLSWSPTLAEQEEPAVATVPDDEVHEAFERIDAESRWAGVALVDSRLLGSTAAMLGDWDLQSTLLRRTLQEGALRLPQPTSAGNRCSPIARADRRLPAQSHRRLARARDRLGKPVHPAPGRGVRDRATDGDVGQAVMADLGRAWADPRRRGLLPAGWLGIGLGLLLLSTPLDLVAGRLAAIRCARCRRACLAASHCGRRPASCCSRSAGGKPGTEPAGARW